MIGNDAVGSVDSIDILGTKFASIRSCATKFLDLVHDRLKNIGIIVGQLVLEDRDDAFEAHSSVYVFRRKRLEGSVFLTIELDKDVIPDFDDCRVVTVD